MLPEDGIFAEKGSHSGDVHRGHKVAIAFLGMIKFYELEWMWLKKMAAFIIENAPSHCSILILNYLFTSIHFFQYNLLTTLNTLLSRTNQLHNPNNP